MEVLQNTHIIFAVCHQKDLVGHGTLAALGGAVDNGNFLVAGFRDSQRGGAAAVQTDCGYAAQLYQPLGKHAEGGTHAVAGLTAVHRVEDHVARSRNADGGAGCGGNFKAGLGFAVFG